MHHLITIQAFSPQIPATINNHNPKTRILLSSSSIHFAHNLQIHDDEDHYNDGCFGRIVSNRARPLWVVSAMEKEQSKFKVDPDKARQALDQLDQQFDSLSRKQVNPPKIRASSLSNMKKDDEMMMKEDGSNSTENSGPFLAFLTFALLAFTVFYNVLFLTVIKPSIDGPDDIIVDTKTVNPIEAAK